MDTWLLFILLRATNMPITVTSTSISVPSTFYSSNIEPEFITHPLAVSNWVAGSGAAFFLGHFFQEWNYKIGVHINIADLIGPKILLYWVNSLAE